MLVAGSFILRALFALVASTRSGETFVALCLLVSVGMGAIAKGLGLTDTAGAFAAGVRIPLMFFFFFHGVNDCKKN